VVSEAELSETDAGLVPAGAGWFVVNARDARWFRRPGRGHGLPLTGVDAFEAETYFPMLGMSIQVLAPGEPNSMYHWENDQEDFLVLAGEAHLVVEGQERLLRQWDFVHCPPGTKHVFVGAGEGPCVILAVSSRQFQATENWGGYVYHETADRHGACPAGDTTDADVAYARFPASQPVRYRDGLLPF
jgi:mannose-6-phosphate isomerase-like protein (cupin superfamily)